MVAATTLTLLIPGLLGPLPAAAKRWEALTAARPALTTWLARARAESARRPHYYALLDALFARTPEGPLPAAALGLVGEGAEPAPQGVWLRADPVHLRADRDRVMLFAPPRIALDQTEAASLVAECNRFLAQDGLALRALAPQRWYLGGSAHTHLEAAPLCAVNGRYIDDYMPRGADARRWLALLTELQMLLHGAGANMTRESEGRASINSVWLWGEGELPREVRGAWTEVYADEPVLRGLARLSGARVEALPPRLPATGGAALVCLLSCQEALQADDLEQWLSSVDALERDWLAPALERLRGGELDVLSLRCEVGGWRLRRGDLRRFWRRPGPLLKYLEF